MCSYVRNYNAMHFILNFRATRMSQLVYVDLDFYVYAYIRIYARMRVHTSARVRTLTRTRTRYKVIQHTIALYVCVHVGPVILTRMHEACAYAYAYIYYIRTCTQNMQML